MYNLYEIIAQLCEDAKIKPGKMCSDLNLSRGMITDLKMGRKQTLASETLAKIAVYFNVPMGFLSGQNPFDYWDQINSDRKLFMHCFFPYWERDVQDIRYLWGVDPNDPENARVVDFVHFIDATVEHLALYNECDWYIDPKPICQIPQIVSIPTTVPHQNIINDELIAFYGDVKDDLTEDDIDDLMVAMRAKAERNKRKKSGG